jgi:hypothetical protein
MNSACSGLTVALTEALMGAHLAERGFIINLEHPARPREQAGEILIKRGGVADQISTKHPTGVV